MATAILKLYPAYGRIYHTAAALLEDWNKGLDFSVTVLGGPYTSIRDVGTFKEQGLTHVQLKDVRTNFTHVEEI